METHLSRNELEDIFWRATMICLGLDPDSKDEAVQKRVRISWPSSETGNTDWERNENVVFLRISPGLDEYGTLSDISYAHDADTDVLKEVVQYHRNHQIHWVCYGPDSDSDADRIRIGILRDAIRASMRKQNIAVQPHIREPIRMPEQDESGEWWERCDLTAQCYELVTREYAADYIDVPPSIITTHE